MSTAEHAEVNRRDFLYIATGAVGAVGAALTAWPFINQMNPDASVLALASVEVDLAPIAEGQEITIKWRGNPVFIRHRTASRKSRRPRRCRSSELPDPLARNANLPDGDPATDVNRVVGGKEQFLVMMGVCTHLGCVPIRQRGRLCGRRRQCQDRRLVLPLPRLALRHRRPHPQGPGAAEPAGAAVRLSLRHQDPHRLRRTHPHERTFELSAQERLREVVP